MRPVLKPSPRCGGVWRRALGRWLGLAEVMGLGPQRGISALMQRSFPHEEAARGRKAQASKGPHQEPNGRHLDLSLQPLGL